MAFCIQCNTCNSILSDNSVFHSSSKQHAFIVMDAITNVNIVTPSKQEKPKAFISSNATWSKIMCKNCTVDPLGLVIHSLDVSSSTTASSSSDSSSSLQTCIERYILFSTQIKCTNLGYAQYDHVSMHAPTSLTNSSVAYHEGRGNNNHSSSSSTSPSPSSSSSAAAAAAIIPQNQTKTLSNISNKEEIEMLKGDIIKMKKVMLIMSAQLTDVVATNNAILDYSDESNQLYLEDESSSSSSSSKKKRTLLTPGNDGNSGGKKRKR